MSTGTFQIRIACILPLVFEAQIEDIGFRKWRVWHPWEFTIRLLRQMELCHRNWWLNSGGRIEISYRISTPEKLVTQIGKHTKSKVYRIDAPTLEELTGPDFLKGSMVRAIWLPFDSEVFLELSRKKRAPYTSDNNLNLWIQCCEAQELARTKDNPRDAASHELKHWVKKICCKKLHVSLPCPDKKRKKRKKEERKFFFWELRSRLDSDAICKLNDCYPRDETWAARWPFPRESMSDPNRV